MLWILPAGRKRTGVYLGHFGGVSICQTENGCGKGEFFARGKTGRMLRID